VTLIILNDILKNYTPFDTAFQLLQEKP